VPRKAGPQGRRGTPAEQVLRLLVLKHVRDWSFEVVVRVQRLNFDRTVLPVQLERRRFVGQCVLAAQFFLNSRERVSYSSDLGGYIRSPTGCFGNVFQLGLES
jgi:hypothetical protein